MKNDQVAFGIDIGGTNTKIGLFDYEGNLLHYSTHRTNKDLSPDQFIQELGFECEEILSTKIGVPFGSSRLVGVGVGAPMANFFSGMVDHAPNLGWKNVPLKKLLIDTFKTNAVIENDANLAAVGEKKWGAGRAFTDFILVTLGTGVGTGLILDGKLYRGHNALGGEGGHIILSHTKKRLCSCGGVDHLESYLSAQGIKETIFEFLGEHWTIEKLGQEFLAQNPKALSVIHCIAHELATGLSTMAVLFGPEAFIIGGGVSKLGEQFNKVVEEKFNELVHFSLKNKVKILSASLSRDKGAVYGGAAHIIDEVFR